MIKQNLDIKNYIYARNYSKMFQIYINNIIGRLLKKGQKEWVLKNFFTLKYLLKLKSKKSINMVLFISLINSIVTIHFRKKRFGGQKKELPIFVNNRRQVTFMVRNLINFSYSKRNKLISFERLIDNIKYSSERKGLLIRKNYQTYKKAIENRVFIRNIRKKRIKIAKI